MKVCKVFGMNYIIPCWGERQFPTGRDSEIARTGFLIIFWQKLYTPAQVNTLEIN